MKTIIFITLITELAVMIYCVYKFTTRIIQLEQRSIVDVYLAKNTYTKYIYSAKVSICLALITLIIILLTK